jgi:tetratricopeptide (TPR) repeat protein
LSVVLSITFLTAWGAAPETVDAQAVLPPGTVVTQTQTGTQPGATQAVAPQTSTVEAVLPELNNLRNQLRMMELSNEEMQKTSAEAAAKFETVVQQNAALSNVLSGLQQTLVTQREREAEMAKANTAFILKVIAGAAAAIFLVFLFSYWFQLRCMNRVMEFSKTMPALQGAHEPALLAQDNSANSKLLSAMKMLEHRLEQLETPGHVAAATGSGNVPTLLESGAIEPATSSSMSLLMAKGQVLLDTERLQEAVACFQEAATVDPTHAEAHLKKGIALERMNRLEPALAAYEEALRLNPKRTVANVYKARVLAALHRYDEAISVYDSALGRNTSKVETPIFAS